MCEKGENGMFRSVLGSCLSGFLFESQGEKYRGMFNISTVKYVSLI